MNKCHKARSRKERKNCKMSEKKPSRFLETNVFSSEAGCIISKNVRKKYLFLEGSKNKSMKPGRACGQTIGLRTKTSLTEQRKNINCLNSRTLVTYFVVSVQREYDSEAIIFILFNWLFWILKDKIKSIMDKAKILFTGKFVLNVNNKIQPSVKQNFNA